MKTNDSFKKVDDMKNEEILNKGCSVVFGKDSYWCYNVTSMMHFCKKGKDGSVLSFKNKSNILNMTKEQVLRFIEIGSAKIEIGAL